jgi:hypothetical protein
LIIWDLFSTIFRKETNFYVCWRSKKSLFTSTKNILPSVGFFFGLPGSSFPSHFISL